MQKKYTSLIWRKNTGRDTKLLHKDIAKIYTYEPIYVLMMELNNTPDKLSLL